MSSRFLGGKPSKELWLDLLIHFSDLCIGGTFVVVFLKLRKSRSAAGLSLQTLATVVGARVLHLLSCLAWV